MAQTEAASVLTERLSKIRFVEHFVLHFVAPGPQKPRKVREVIDKVKDEVANLRWAI